MPKAKTAPVQKPQLAKQLKLGGNIYEVANVNFVLQMRMEKFGAIAFKKHFPKKKFSIRALGLWMQSDPNNMDVMFLTLDLALIAQGDAPPASELLQTYLPTGAEQVKLKEALSFFTKRFSGKGLKQVG